MKASLERLSERAAAESLLDIAYANVDSPFGPLLIATTPRGLVKVSLPSHDADETLQDLAARISPRVLEAPAQPRRSPSSARPLLRRDACTSSTCRSTGS